MSDGSDVGAEMQASPSVLDTGQMLTRRFGRTGLDMPVFSCGGMRFQQSWTDSGQDIEPAAQGRLEETVLAALAAGINHLETARGYGTSERQLGLLLPRLDRDDLILQTKVSPEPDPDLFAANVEESFARLNVDRIDLLSLHGINTWEKLWWSLRPDGCLARARRLQSEGRVGSIGFSTHGNTDLIVSALEHEGDGGFDYVNLHWYFISRRHDRALSVAAERDVGVFVISPSDKGGRLYDPPPELADLCAPLTPLVFNNAWCLSNPLVHTLSVGAARPSDFDPVAPSLTALSQPEVVSAIEDRLAVAMRDATGVGHPDELLVGLPEYEDAPGFMNLRVMVWLRALTLGWGLSEYATGRYRMLGTASDWFPGINAANVAEWDLAKAVSESPYAREIPAWLAETHEMLGGAPVARLSQS